VVGRKSRKQRIIDELYHIHVTAEDMRLDIRRTYLSSGMLDWEHFEKEVIEVSEKLHKLFHSMPALEAATNSPDANLVAKSSLGGLRNAGHV